MNRIQLPLFKEEIASADLPFEVSTRPISCDSGYYHVISKGNDGKRYVTASGVDFGPKDPVVVYETKKYPEQLNLVVVRFPGYGHAHGVFGGYYETSYEIFLVPTEGRWHSVAECKPGKKWHRAVKALSKLADMYQEYFDAQSKAVLAEITVSPALATSDPTMADFIRVARKAATIPHPCTRRWAEARIMNKIRRIDLKQFEAQPDGFFDLDVTL